MTAGMRVSETEAVRAYIVCLWGQRVHTWATGGKANLRESSGVGCMSSSCSSCDCPSSAWAGRVYWATKESMTVCVTERSREIGEREARQGECEIDVCRVWS